MKLAVMQFREFPWTLETVEQYAPDNPPAKEEDHLPPPPPSRSSFLTHRQVLQYLQAYACYFGLESYITFGATVQQLTLLTDSPSFFQPPADTSDAADEKENEIWPQIQLEWTVTDSQQHSNNPPQLHSQSLMPFVFAMVIIANRSCHRFVAHRNFFAATWCIRSRMMIRVFLPDRWYCVSEDVPVASTWHANSSPQEVHVTSTCLTSRAERWRKLAVQTQKGNKKWNSRTNTKRGKKSNWPDKRQG